MFLALVPPVTEVQALELALADEYKGASTYEAVLDRWGANTMPFRNIVRAELQHARLVVQRIDQIGHKPAPNAFARQEKEAKADWYRRLEMPATLNEMYKDAYQAEVDNIKLYDGFLTQGYPEATNRLFSKLRADSKDRHLPAFARKAGLPVNPGF
jgi:hypothetical protein